MFLSLTHTHTHTNTHTNTHTHKHTHKHTHNHTPSLPLSLPPLPPSLSLSLSCGRLAVTSQTSRKATDVAAQWKSAPANMSQTAALLVENGLSPTLHSFYDKSAGQRRLNIYSVIQSSRGDGAEAVVLHAPLSEDNAFGIGSAVALAQHIAGLLCCGYFFFFAFACRACCLSLVLASGSASRKGCNPSPIYTLTDFHPCFTIPSHG